LNSAYVSSDIFHRRFVFERQPVALALRSRSIDQNPRVRRQTGERHRDVIIQQLNLSDRSGILKLRNRLALDTEHHDIGATHADGERTLSHSFHRVFNLSKRAVIKSQIVRSGKVFARETSERD
jgi:hypothetical protein